MKEQDQIGLLIMAISIVFVIILGEFLIESWKGIVIMGFMFIFIPLVQWAIEKQKEVIHKNEKEELK